jgi:phosphonate dehydrogenase
MRDSPYRGWRPAFYGRTLRGADVGIVGMGELGQAIAVPLVALGDRVAYADRQPVPAHTAASFDLVRRPLEAMIEDSNVVIAALPLTPETHGLIDQRLIAGMRRDAVLVNIGRGSTIDEMAAADALDAGRLAGYAADVHASEDWALPGHPPTIPAGLLNHPRTLLTSHLGSAAPTAVVAPIACPCLAASVSTHCR